MFDELFTFHQNQSMIDMHSDNVVFLSCSIYKVSKILGIFLDLFEYQRNSKLTQVITMNGAVPYIGIIDIFRIKNNRFYRKLNAK